MNLRRMILVLFAGCSGMLSAQSDYRSLLFATGDIVLLRADSVVRSDIRSVPPHAETSVIGTVIMQYDRTQGKFVPGAYEQTTVRVYDRRWTAGPHDIAEQGKLYIIFLGRTDKEEVVQHAASVLAFENYTIADPGHHFSRNDVMSIESFELLLRKSFF